MKKKRATKMKNKKGKENRNVIKKIRVDFEVEENREEREKRVDVVSWLDVVGRVGSDLF